MVVVVLQSATLLLHVQNCLLYTQLVWYLSRLVRVARLGGASQVQGHWLVILEDKVAIPHSERLPRRMAVAAVARARQPQQPGVLGPACVPRVPLHTLPQSMAVAVGVGAEVLPASDWWVVAPAVVVVQQQAVDQVYGHAMEGWVVAPAVASRQEIADSAAGTVGHDLWKQPAVLRGQVVVQVSTEQVALHLLLAACSAKAAVVVVEAPVVMVVLVVQVDAAQGAVVAREAAAHTQLVLVVLAAMAGPWCWSFEHETVCRC